MSSRTSTSPTVAVQYFGITTGLTALDKRPDAGFSHCVIGVGDNFHDCYGDAMQQLEGLLPRRDFDRHKEATRQALYNRYDSFPKIRASISSGRSSYMRVSFNQPN